MIDTLNSDFELAIKGAFRMKMENGAILRFEGFITQDEQGKAVLDAES